MNDRPDQHQTTETRDEEAKRVLLAANDLAGLMRCRLVPVEWKMRAFGCSEALIQELFDQYDASAKTSNAPDARQQELV